MLQPTTTSTNNVAKASEYFHNLSALSAARTNAATEDNLLLSF